VADMLEASGKISGYVSGTSFEDCCADTRTVDAVVRNLEIIGEASRGIPDDKKLLKPEIDWAAIRGLRNRIVHEYFGLSLSVIWTIVQTDSASSCSAAQLLVERIPIGNQRPWPCTPVPDDPPDHCGEH
jgi:uncharacterized protein with HEPN domain